MGKVIIITGATATGKTGAAIAAKKTDTILSADSIQVYKYADIVSGKDIPQNSSFTSLSENKYKMGYFQLEGKRLYGVDIVNPSYNFSVFDYLEYCKELLLEKTFNKNQFALVGGTAQYIKALLEPIDTINIPADSNLRRKLSHKSAQELQNILKKKSAKKLEAMNHSDRNNPRRLIRAIEISSQDTKSIKSKSAPLSRYKHKILALHTNPQAIRERINKRVNERIQDGAFEEAQKLFKDYDSISENLKKANGYKQLFDYFQKKITREEAIQRWKYSEYLHAKNQNTYIKKYLNPTWIDVETKQIEKQVNHYVEELFEEKT